MPISIKKPIKPKKRPVVKKEPTKTKAEKEVYIEAIGRRKTSVARVRIYPNQKGKKDTFDVIVNEKPFEKYFVLGKHQKIILSPFNVSGENYSATISVSGGGVSSQAEAVRLGFSRVLIKHKADYRSKLKSLGFLKRDPRMVERKKFGSRKARRPQQWRKR